MNIEEIPGRRPHPTKRYIYVQSGRRRKDLKELFDGLGEASQRLGKTNRRGGIGTENVECCVPSQAPICLQCLAMKGDVEDWRAAVLDYAKEAAILTAEISGDLVVLSDGRVIPIQSCSWEQYRNLGR